MDNKRKINVFNIIEGNIDFPKIIKQKINLESWTYKKSKALLFKAKIYFPTVNCLKCPIFPLCFRANLDILHS